MRKRDILKIAGINGITEFMSESDKEHYQIDDYVGGILRGTPEDSIIFNRTSDFEAMVVLKDSHTKAFAVSKDGICIGTKKEIPPKAREGLDESDIFFCAWPDPRGRVHLVWIEQMGKKFQNCMLSIIGYEPEEASYFSKVMLQAMVQAKMAKRDEYKPLLDKVFKSGDCGILIPEPDSPQFNGIMN